MLFRLPSSLRYHPLRARSAAMIVLIAILPAGCTAPITGSSALAQKRKMLLRTLGDISDSARTRKRADQQLLGTTAADDPARLAVLVRVVGGYGQQPAMKMYAMDQIMNADKLLGIAVLARQIPRFQHWRVLIHACALAQSTGDAALVDPLILSLKRPAHRFTFAHRPEAQAIRALCHSGLRHCLADTFLHGHSLTVRLAALNLLYHLLPPTQLYALVLNHKRVSDPMLSALRWYARIFFYVPHTAEQVAWIEEFHGGGYLALARAAARHCRLLPNGNDPHRMDPPTGQTSSPAAAAKPLQAAARSGQTLFPAHSCMPRGIPPRLIGLLARLAHPQQYAPPNVLKRIVEHYYAGHRHVRRPGPYPGSPDNPNPSLADNASRLSYCDLLLVENLYAALAHRYFRADITRLGQASQHNARTEEGGLIQWRNSSRKNRRNALPELRLKRYPSLKQINNGVYVTGPGLLLNTPSGLAQFIFHFQKTDNQRYTGPAPGDLRYVRAVRCVVVIFTSLSRHAFDVTADYPDGAVLDLGVFQKCRRFDNR